MQHFMCLYYPRFFNEPFNQTINQQYPRGAQTRRATINFSSQGQRTKVKGQRSWSDFTEVTETQSLLRLAMEYLSIKVHRFLIISFQFLCRQTDRQTDTQTGRTDAAENYTCFAFSL